MNTLLGILLFFIQLQKSNYKYNYFFYIQIKYVVKNLINLCIKKNFNFH
jgi:hypothetical protein